MTKCAKGPCIILIVFTPFTPNSFFKTALLPSVAKRQGLLCCLYLFHVVYIYFIVGKTVLVVELE